MNTAKKSEVVEKSSQIEVLEGGKKKSKSQWLRTIENSLLIACGMLTCFSLYLLTIAYRF